MDKQKATIVMEQTAQRYHTTPDAVRQEILAAAREAMGSDHPAAKAFWNRVAPDGALPSAEELIHILSAYCIARGGDNFYMGK